MVQAQKIHTSKEQGKDLYVTLHIYMYTLYVHIICNIYMLQRTKTFIKIQK